MESDTKNVINSILSLNKITDTSLNIKFEFSSDIYIPSLTSFTIKVSDLMSSSVAKTISLSVLAEIDPLPDVTHQHKLYFGSNTTSLPTSRSYTANFTNSSLATGTLTVNYNLAEYTLGGLKSFALNVIDNTSTIVGNTKITEEATGWRINKGIREVLILTVDSDTTGGVSTLTITRNTSLAFDFSIEFYCTETLTGNVNRNPSTLQVVYTGGSGGGVVTPDPGDTTSTYPSIRIYAAAGGMLGIVRIKDNLGHSYQTLADIGGECIMNSGQVELFISRGASTLTISCDGYRDEKVTKAMLTPGRNEYVDVILIRNDNIM